MRLLRLLLSPFALLLRLLGYPLRARRRARALKAHGWVELHLEGEILELRPIERRGQRWLRRFLGQEQPRRIVLQRLRQLVDELKADPHAKGVLVRIGPLGGGWASADAVRAELDRLKAAKIPILAHIATHAGNREFLVASPASKLWMTPSGGLAAVGASSPGLFLKDLLERFGVRVEVAARGRYKTAPHQFTKNERTPENLEQTKALVDAFDGALLDGASALYGVDRVAAEKFLDRAPLIGVHALEEGWAHALVRDEGLIAAVEGFAGVKAPNETPGEKDDKKSGHLHFVGAGTYLEARHLRPILRKKKKVIGIVEVKGAIVDRGAAKGPIGGPAGAVEATVVADLRAALRDPSIGAVVLHVDSRGGSVTASDAIYAAVKRLDQEKPVIACFGDYAASGGYYVACGARAIVAAPLTVTGSIGVFAMLPTWPQLAARFEVHHDLVKNRRHAGLYSPWTGFDDDDRAFADREVGAMYETFLALVAEARKKTRDEIHAIAEGHVWTGAAAKDIGLVDGLGGMPEALTRAKEAFGKAVAEDPVSIKAHGDQSRPSPFDPRPPEKAQSPLVWLEHLAGAPADLAVLHELWLLASTTMTRPRALAYLPMSVD